jgi:acyl-CoA reductase-like NAD-dependent aldehyde dehydrogenase
MHAYNQDFINGIWTGSSGAKTTTVVDPTTEVPCATVRHSAADDVNRAAIAASRAFPAWATTAPEARAALLDRALSNMAEMADEFVKGMAGEIGVPVWFGRNLQVPMPLKNGAVAAEAARKMSWNEFHGPSLVTKVPVGVVGAITPWNAPLHQIVAKVFAALAAGCTVVLKPSELVPSTAVLFAKALDDAGFPAGVFNMVWGDAAIGEAVCRHPLIDMVSFTGSERGGRAVAEAAGRDVKRVALELGGKSAAILLEDAPLEKAVGAVLTSCFANSGQTCVAQSRLLVPRHLLKDVESFCRDAVATWTIGDPRNEATRLGPVATAAQYDRVREYIGKGKTEGARLVAGGSKRPASLDAGFFVAPTVFFDVAPEMTIAQEEIFGPVLSVIAYEEVEEAVAISNGTRYGLSGSVWGDVGRAAAVASQLRTGQVSLNGAPQNFLAPFGGVKKSGFGRENGYFGVEEFLQLRAVHGAPAV